MPIIPMTQIWPPRLERRPCLSQRNGGPGRCWCHRKQVLKQQHQIQTLAWVESVGPIDAQIDPSTVTFDKIEASPVRCPDPKFAQSFIEHIDHAPQRTALVESSEAIVRVFPLDWVRLYLTNLKRNSPKPCFPSQRAKGLKLVPDFSGTRRLGSEHNDRFTHDGSAVKTQSNHSGGIQGGISNGMPIDFRVAFKPVATIFKSQHTIDSSGQETTIAPKGRHDPCVVPRAVPIVEAGAALVLRLFGTKINPQIVPSIEYRSRTLDSLFLVFNKARNRFQHNGFYYPP